MNFTKLVRQFVNAVITEPALVNTVLVSVAALVAAYFSHVTKTQEAAIVTIGTGLAAILTAAMARPVNVVIITGTLTTLAAASVSFGLHLSPAIVATTITGIGVLLSLVLRGHLTYIISLEERPVTVPGQVHELHNPEGK